MSAFVVSTQHIQYLVTTAKKFGTSGVGFTWLDPALKYHAKLDPFERAQLTRLGQVLLDANCKSVDVRYPNAEDVGVREVYAHRGDWRGPLDPVQVIKAVQCLDYQACESADWRESEACAILEALKSRAIDSLPGYDEAAWEINAALA